MKTISILFALVAFIVTLTINFSILKKTEVKLSFVNTSLAWEEDDGAADEENYPQDCSYTDDRGVQWRGHEVVCFVGNIDCDPVSCYQIWEG